MKVSVFTIGHSTHKLEKFFGLLLGHSVTAVADVRSTPYSRVNPQFNREDLRARLGVVGVEYVFLGQELGARSDDRGCYIGGKVQYDRLARTVGFQRGLERVIEGAHQYRIALMCAEKDPLTCHRCILVSRHLVSQDVDVQHILADGSLESHSQALKRLLSELQLRQRDLFRGENELIEEAYRVRGDAIAYVEKPVEKKAIRGITR